MTGPPSGDEIARLQRLTTDDVDQRQGGDGPEAVVSGQVGQGAVCVAGLAVAAAHVGFGCGQRRQVLLASAADEEGVVACGVCADENFPFALGQMA